jgi:hypothetical protein
MTPKHPEALAFINKTRDKTTWTRKEFLLFCKDATKLAREYPEDKDKLAYWIVSHGAALGDIDRAINDIDKICRRIRNLAADLELPDHHVYTGDGLSVAKKWQVMEGLVEEGLTMTEDGSQQP